jgi:putative peptidoglycan lipid II flippase
VVGLCTLASRILGLIRDIGMATLFGAGPVMDAFAVAFRIPNLFRRLFGEGALTAAFLPLFVRETHHGEPGAGAKLATAVLTVLTLVLGAITLAGELVLGGMLLFAPLSGEGRLLTGLTAALLPYVVLICVAAQLSAMLNALNQFAWPALVPVLMNILWIAGMLWIVPLFDEEVAQAYALSVCILVAGAFQMVSQWPVLRRAGYHFDLDWAWARPRLRELFSAMAPVLVGLTVAQINTVADSFLAWAFSPGAKDGPTMSLPGHPPWPVSAGAASALYFGQRLYQFPLGIFGVALSTVMFPLFARHAEAHRLDLLRDDLGLGLRLVLAIGLPASAGLVLMAEPITSLFFRHGAFSADALRQTSAVVAAYAIAVWAWCGLLIVTRASYAAGNRRTPLRLGMVTVAFNFLLTLALIWPLGGTGLALATSTTAIFQLSAATWILQRSIGRLDWRRLAWCAARCLAATAILAVVAAITLFMLPEGESLAMRVMRVAVPMATATAAWFAAATLLRLEEVWLLISPERSTRTDSL